MTLFSKEKEKSKSQNRWERKIRKREKTRSAYMKSLARKPRYLREVMRILPLLLIIMLTVDFAFTKLAAAYYIGWADQEIERYEDKIDRLLTGRENASYDAIDFNQALCPAAGAADAERERLYRAMGELSYRLSDEIFTVPGDNPSLFARIWDNYCFRNATQQRYYHYDIPFWDSAYCALYNAEGQRLADESAGIYLIVIREQDGDLSSSWVYALDAERIEEKHPGTFEELREHLNPALNGGREDVRLNFNGLYIKDYTMLPAEIVIVEGDTPAATYDLSDCDFSGYSLLTLEEWSYPSDEHSFQCIAPDGMTLRFLGPVLAGDHILRDYHEEFFARLDQNEAAENVKLAAQAQTPVYCLERTAWQVSGYVCKPARNETVVSLVTVDYDFFRDWKEILAWVYGLNLAAALLITFFGGWIRFQKRHLSYEVDAYRRRTTDAMAHDLKSPLMAISGYAENIASRTEPSKTAYYADSILSVVKDMDRTIGNILDLSKAESGRETLRLGETALRKLVEEQIDKYEPNLKEKELTVTVEGESLICADEEGIRHLIDNLLSNAVRYARRGSEILVSLSGDAFIVRNAFDYELTADPRTLLDPFVKGDMARSDAHGSGLGLSIVNRIAQAHGFSVEIEVAEQMFEVRVVMPR